MLARSDNVGAAPPARVAAPVRVGCGTCRFRSRCLPAGLTGEALAGFERAVLRHVRPVKAGGILVRQGEPVQALYALRVGALKAVVDTTSGAEYVVGFRLPGTVIGLAEGGRGHWARSFVALEDAWLCRIPVQVLDERVLQVQLVKLISEHLRREYESHLVLASKAIAARLATFLLAISESQQRRGLAPTRFTLPMSFADIASFLGTRHESVSRALAELRRRGLVAHKGRRFEIPNLSALRDLRTDSAIGH